MKPLTFPQRLTCIDLLDAEVFHVQWLTPKSRSLAFFLHPQRGEKFRLLQMTSANARHALMRHMIRTGYADDRTNQALLQLESALAATRRTAY